MPCDPLRQHERSELEPCCRSVRQLNHPNRLRLLRPLCEHNEVGETVFVACRSDLLQRPGASPAELGVRKHEDQLFHERHELLGGVMAGGDQRAGGLRPRKVRAELVK